MATGSAYLFPLTTSAAYNEPENSTLIATGSAYLFPLTTSASYNKPQNSTVMATGFLSIEHSRQVIPQCICCGQYARPNNGAIHTVPDDVFIARSQILMTHRPNVYRGGEGGGVVKRGDQKEGRREEIVV